MACNHLIDLNDFRPAEWFQIVDLAKDIMKNPRRYYGICDGKIMATLFYEPSTRTQMSFQAAMTRLGGGIIGFDNPLNSSVAKGESVKDTVKIVSGYSDLLVIRNPQEGCAKAAALYSSCPVINAGDGGHLHPTQTLTDLVTLATQMGTLKGLTIGLCGDLKNGRTVHSLIKALSQFDNRFVLISTPELSLPIYMKDILDAQGCHYQEIYNLEDAIGSLDVLYMTRIQKERFASQEEYDQQKNTYILDKKKMQWARQDMIVMHPLPRVDEIAQDVDEDPRSKYFEQARCGMYARMALITYLLRVPRIEHPVKLHQIHPDIRCTNPKCVTVEESYLPHAFSEVGGMYICDYCEQRIVF